MCLHFKRSHIFDNSVSNIVQLVKTSYQLRNITRPIDNADVVNQDLIGLFLSGARHFHSSSFQDSHWHKSVWRLEEERERLSETDDLCY